MNTNKATILTSMMASMMEEEESIVYLDETTIDEEEDDLVASMQAMTLEPDELVRLECLLDVLEEHMKYNEYQVQDACFLRHTRRFLQTICWDSTHSMYDDLKPFQRSLLTQLYNQATHIDTTSSRNTSDYWHFFHGIKIFVDSCESQSENS
jgi:hypothetical protein